MASVKKWYVVWVGIEPGVYDSWEECQQQVMGVAKAKYKSFATQSDALRAFEDGYELYYSKRGNKVSDTPHKRDYPKHTALSVDAACSGNPGVMEYRGVLIDSRREVFRIGPFPQGTNNIGEFLALVHGLALLKKADNPMPIYSDSKIAIGWVKKKRCKTLLKRTPQSEKLLDMVARAEHWLQTNTYTTPIYKWQTEEWGEIPADFGRK